MNRGWIARPPRALPGATGFRPVGADGWDTTCRLWPVALSRVGPPSTWSTCLWHRVSRGITIHAVRGHAVTARTAREISSMLPEPGRRGLRGPAGGAERPLAGPATGRPPTQESATLSTERKHGNRPQVSCCVSGRGMFYTEQLRPPNSHRAAAKNGRRAHTTPLSTTPASAWPVQPRGGRHRSSGSSTREETSL